MSYLFKHLKRNCKQILSFALAFIVFTEPSLQSYASTSLPVIISSEESIDSYAESPDPDFDPKTYDGIPFYFDEDGNKVYDEENIYKDYVKPEYLGIARTFEEYPLTTIDYSVDDISTYVVGIDDAALAVLAVTLATYGVYVGHEAIKDFASTNFEPWVRTKYGNDSSVMENIQSWLAVKAGTVFAGMELFSNVVGNFIKSGQVKDSTLTISSHPTLSTATYAPLGNKPSGYITSYEYTNPRYNNFLLRGYIYSDRPDGYALRGLYTSDSDEFYAVYVKGSGDSLSINKSYGLYYLAVSYNKVEDYYGTPSRSGINSFEDKLPVLGCLKLPVFKDTASMISYFKYGTSGGTVSLPEFFSTPDTSISLKKTWSNLLTNSSAYTRSNTMNVPDSSSAISDLLNRIYASDTEDEVIENVNSVWKVQKKASKPNLSAGQSYSHLSYILSAIAAYAGASVTSEQIDSFINEYYGKYVDGSSTNVNEQAYSIASNWLSVTNDNGDPDNENKNNNKYTIAQKLASAFVTFLVAIHAIDSSFNITDNSDISSNIKVAASAGTTTKPGTGTGSNPDIDYSGSLGNIASILTSILSAIGILPSILSLLQAIPDNIKSGILNGIENSVLGKYVAFATVELTAIGNAIKSWDIEAWIHGVSTDLGKSIDNYGEAIGAKLDSLPHVDDITSGIASALEHNALTDAVINISDKLASFPIDNYGDTFIKALQTALAALGLGSLAGTIGALKDLTDIRTGDIAERLKALADAIADLKVGTAVDLESLAAALTGVLAGLGLGELAGSIAKIGEKVDSFSLTDVIDLIKALPASIASEKLPGSNNNNNNETENDSGFTNFLNLFMIVLFIIVMLLILFINCLRFIVLVFNIPAFDGLLNENILRGINYLKEVNLPLLGDNLSLYNLLLSCAYFVIFLSVIAVIRKKIDKIHI